MHQYPGHTALLGEAQLLLGPVGGVCPGDIGRILLCQCDGGFHSLEAIGHFRPDIAFQPRGGFIVGEVDRVLVAATGADDLDRRLWRRRAAPVRLDPHRRILRPCLDAAEVIMIARHHRVDPGTGAEFEQFEAGADSSGKPEQAGHEAGRAAGFVGLRRAVEPGQQLGIMIGHDLPDQMIDLVLAGDPAFVNIGQSRLPAAEIEIMQAAGEAQRHCVFQRFSRPVRDLLSAGGRSVDQCQLGDDDRCRHGRIIAPAMLRLTPHPVDDIFHIHNVH